MLGLRDVLLIAPTHSLHQQTQPISFDHLPTLPLSSSTALGVGLGIFPFFTPTPSASHPQQSPTNANTDYCDRKKLQELNSSKKNLVNVENGEQFVENDGRASGTRPCKDCGNKAKKDCGYGRCRTCCRGRGFDCSTHVRSTWVSASHRRERQKIVVSGNNGYVVEDGSSGSSSGVKRPRVLVPLQAPITTSHTSTSIVNTPRSFGATSSPQEDENFKKSLPGQVQAPAVFRCHRVTAIGHGEAEIIYQVTVRISGHVFKGFLYDQGADEKNEIPCISSSLQMENNSTSGRNAHQV